MTSIVNFNVKTCREILLQDTAEHTKTNKGYSRTLAYVKKFFYQLDYEYNGDVIAYKNNEFMQLPSKIIYEELKKVGKVVKELFMDDPDRYELISKMGQPMFLADNFLNVSYQFIHTPKVFNDFSPKVKDNVKIILDNLMETWANGNVDVYEYLLNWFAKVAHGDKTQICLYLRSIEGTGKSTFTGFLHDHVFGRHLCNRSSSRPLTGDFNFNLKGRLLVLFEEVPTFDKATWHGVSGKIKTMITENTLNFKEEHKSEKSYDNYINCIVNTNYNALKEANGRRFFCVDISTKYIGEEYNDYWDKVHDAANHETGDAFYSFLMERDVSKFKAFQNMPMTHQKENAQALNINTFQRFIKELFILKKKSLNVSACELLGYYKNFYGMKSDDATIYPLKFKIQMEENGFESRKTGGVMKYVYTLEELSAIAKKGKWMHTLDEFEDEDNQDNKDNKKFHILDELESDNEVKLLSDSLLNLMTKYKDDKKYENVLKQLEKICGQIKDTENEKLVINVVEPEVIIKIKKIKVVKEPKKKKVIIEDSESDCDDDTILYKNEVDSILKDIIECGNKLEKKVKVVS